MNRREFIGGVAAGVVGLNCKTPFTTTAAKERPMERVELFGPSSYQVDVKCEWSIADRAWFICAVCYDPPVVSCGKVDWAKVLPGQISKSIEAVKDACRKTVVDELDWLLEQQRNSPMAITPQLWETMRLERT